MAGGVFQPDALPLSLRALRSSSGILKPIRAICPGHRLHRRAPAGGRIADRTRAFVDPGQAPGGRAGPGLFRELTPGPLYQAEPALALDLHIRSALFHPSLGGLRSDPRVMQWFDARTQLDYWTATGRWPDFCADPDLPNECREAAQGYIDNR